MQISMNATTEKALIERLGTSRAELHRPPPPCRLLDAQELCLFPAGKKKVHDLVFLERGAIGPAVVFFQVRRLLMIIDESDFHIGALDDPLRLERKRRSRRRSAGHLVGDLGQ